VAAVLVAAAPARAHQLGVSYAELDVAGRAVEGRLRFSMWDAGELVQLDRDGDGQVTERDLATGDRALFAPLEALVLSQRGTTCALTPGRASFEPPDGLALTGTWTCPRPIDALEIEVRFLAAMPPGHVHVARVVLGGRVHERIARAGGGSFTVEGPPSWKAEGLRFLALGVEHIFTGYDHLAFLVGLLLLGGTLRALVKVVTSFTVAHSITLALATLRGLAPPARLVEPLIAATIVFVAAENLWALRSGAGEEAAHAAARRRWLVTFAFGLVHGFGFASVLRDLGLPRDALAASLVAFNVGVEVGQVAVLTLALPLLAAARRTHGFVPHGVRAASLALGGAGLVWLVQRAAGG
jgi:hypothetical protein